MRRRFPLKILSPSVAYEVSFENELFSPSIQPSSASSLCLHSSLNERGVGDEDEVEDAFSLSFASLTGRMPVYLNSQASGVKRLQKNKKKVVSFSYIPVQYNAMHTDTFQKKPCDVPVCRHVSICILEVFSNERTMDFACGHLQQNHIYLKLKQ